VAAALSAPARGYRPRSATNDLKEIVEDCLEEMVRVYDERFRARFGPMHPRVKELFERFVPCGDPHFGFLRWKCCESDCHSKDERIVPLSCKGRGLCPSCGQKRAILWADRMVEEVLPDVPYAQLVFTIPKMLRPSFLWDRSLYGDLCRAAYHATKKFFEIHFPNLEKPVPAMVASPQSFGSLCNFHPHAHSVCSLGVFTRDGVFHPAPDAIDFAPLEGLFREEVFRCLLKKEKITPERVQLLRSWKHSGFRVHSERRVGKGERAELEGLLQYMERPPVSLKRLTYRDDGRVLYTGNYIPSLGRDFQLVSGVEFLALLVPHIALRWESRIRTYGAISTRVRKELGWIAEETRPEPPNEVVVAEEDSEFVKIRRRSWARLIAKVYKEDPILCRSCGKPMRLVSAITSPHQDDVIEKVLKARGAWDPPWLRQRRARGPPTQLEIVATTDDEHPQLPPDVTGDDYSQIRPDAEDDFSQVPPGGHDDE
jgi:hypothetical protein